MGTKDTNINFKAGDKLPDSDGGYFKVMAIAEGYVMARRKRCMPFVQTIKQFQERIKLSQTQI